MDICNRGLLIHHQTSITTKIDVWNESSSSSLSEFSTSGEWIKEEKNYTYFSGIKCEDSLLVFPKQMKMKGIHFQIVKMTVPSNLLKMEMDRNKELTVLNKEIWVHFLILGITITVEYLPSSMNVVTDWQSSNIRDKSETSSKFLQKYAN